MLRSPWAGGTAKHVYRDPVNGNGEEPYNSDKSMRQIVNSVPSACAGRPLLLSNEPNYEGQDWSTIPEISRHTFVLRAWPGELYSWALGGFEYDKADDKPGDNNTCADGQPAGWRKNCGVDSPYWVDWPGIEDYYNDTGRFVSGQSWSLPFDGIAMHFYPWKTEVPTSTTAWDPINNPLHGNIAYQLNAWLGRANQDNWPIMVTEYSLNQCVDAGLCGTETTTRQDVVDRTTVLRFVLEEHLGNYQASNNNNPFKLFWHSYNCNGCVWYPFDFSQSNLWDTGGVKTSVYNAWVPNATANNGP